MRRTDYDTEHYQDYARGRALNDEQLAAWTAALAERLPAGRPLAGLDVGSGTGRFAPALAAAFGPVTGVEPSDRMREVAEAESPHPDVRYLAGAAEDLPVPTASADYAVLMQSWHHVQDKPRAARELARAVRPGGRMVIRTGYLDHMPPIWWLSHFPGASELDATLYRPLHEEIGTLSAAGWRVVDFGTFAEPAGGTRAELYERLRLRTHTIFVHLSEEVVETGFRRLAESVAEDPEGPAPVEYSPLLTVERR